MSDYGDEIIARLGETTNLKKPDNPMARLIDFTIGEWLENFDNNDFIEQFFLQEAKGKHLDLHGKCFNVKRKIDESDENYRKRIIYESLGHLTITFLNEIYGVSLYYFIEDYNYNNNTLTSDNPYLSSNGFMIIADAETRNILDKKFVLNNNISWLII